MFSLQRGVKRSRVLLEGAGEAQPADLSPPDEEARRATTRGSNGARSRTILTHFFQKRVIIIHCGDQGEGIMPLIYCPVGRSWRCSSVVSSDVVLRCNRRVQIERRRGGGRRIGGEFTTRDSHTRSARTQEWTLPFMNHNHNNGI